MTWYLGRATSKLVKLPRELHFEDEAGEVITQERGEFAVERQLKALGIEAHTPRRIEFKRLGKKREAEPITSPYLPGYFFAEIPAALYAEALAVKGIGSTLMTICAAEVKIYVRPFLSKVREENAVAQHIIEANDKAAMCQFKAGDALEILEGPFKDRIVRFERMVQAAHDLHPMIEASVEVLGREAKMRFDPLKARGAA